MKSITTKILVKTGENVTIIPRFTINYLPISILENQKIYGIIVVFVL